MKKPTFRYQIYIVLSVIQIDIVLSQWTNSMPAPYTMPNQLGQSGYQDMLTYNPYQYPYPYSCPPSPNPLTLIVIKDNDADDYNIFDFLAYLQSTDQSSTPTYYPYPIPVPYNWDGTFPWDDKDSDTKSCCCPNDSSNWFSNNGNKYPTKYNYKVSNGKTKKLSQNGNKVSKTYSVPADYTKPISIVLSNSRAEVNYPEDSGEVSGDDDDNNVAVGGTKVTKTCITIKPTIGRRF